MTDEARAKVLEALATLKDAKVKVHRELYEAEDVGEPEALRLCEEHGSLRAAIAALEMI